MAFLYGERDRSYHYRSSGSCNPPSFIQKCYHTWNDVMMSAVKEFPLLPPRWHRENAKFQEKNETKTI